MMINKSMEDISYEDIQLLLENKIDESDILDYKTEMVKKESLMRHICAFANTRGGDIVFGVKESGRGGHPIEVHGIDTSNINKESIEQTVLSNLVPRLDVKIIPIEIPNSTKSILLVRIPDSHLKPHQNNINKKFYKRFQFESAEMTEQEICDCYRGRFRNNDQVEQYIKKASAYKTGLIPADTIKANVIIIPSSIRHRLIETSDYEKFEWFKSIKMSTSTQYASSASFLPSRLEPFSHGLISKESNPDKFRQTRIHRNGCIQHIMDFSDPRKDKNCLPYKYFAVRLMQTLQFASKTLQHYNYFGDVKIMMMITCSFNNTLKLGEEYDPSISTINEINCEIEREHSLQYIETNHEKIASSIMDEVFNHYGVPSCDMFDENGKIINDRL